MGMLEELRALVGDNGVLDAAEVATRSAGVWRPDNLKARALVRPASTAEVSAVLRWCHANRIAVVTQGGLTGLVHGADASSEELILELGRLVGPHLPDVLPVVLADADYLAAAHVQHLSLASATVSSLNMAPVPLRVR